MTIINHLEEKLESWIVTLRSLFMSFFFSKKVENITIICFENNLLLSLSSSNCLQIAPELKLKEHVCGRFFEQDTFTHVYHVN